MNVIWHKAIGQDGDFMLTEIFSETLEIPAVVLGVIKNGLLIVSAIIDVIEALSRKYWRAS